MPDPSRLLTTLRRAVELTRLTPGRKGRLITLPDAEDVLVSGDLHGNVGNFQALMRTAELATHHRRHLILQEVVHSPFRYPGGGDKSHQLLDLYAALKCQFPERVHLLMGNHELAQWTSRPIIKEEENFNELFAKGVREAYADAALGIYAAYVDLFAVLPLAVRLSNRVFISHSLPAAKYLPDFDLAQLEMEQPPASAYAPGGIVFGLLWGRDTAQAHVEEFLQKVDADWLVSGHIPCDEGYALPNDRQVILDCAKSPAAYCLLPADRPLSRGDIVACTHVI
jgi:Calcineurin-like phosphoesterase